MGQFRDATHAISNQRKNHGIHQDTSRAATADGALPDDRHWLSRRRNQHQGVLARRGSGALRRARHGLVRAEVGAGADGRDAGTRALPLRRRRPIRQTVLHRADQPRRDQSQPDGADRRAGGRRGEPHLREDDGPQPRLRAGVVRRFGNQHTDLAGGDCDARQRPIPQSAIRFPIRSAWPVRSCSSTSPSWS